MKQIAEFKAMLPTGGAFYAAWPQTVTHADLRMVKAMLDATLEMWIDFLERRQAGDAEYASWFPFAVGVAPTASPGVGSCAQCPTLVIPAGFSCAQCGRTSGVAVGGHQTFSQQTPTGPENGKA